MESLRRVAINTSTLSTTASESAKINKCKIDQVCFSHKSPHRMSLFLFVMSEGGSEEKVT